MDFVATVLFLVLYYIRPHEWVPGLVVIRPIAATLVLAIWGTWARRGGFSLRDLVKTPHDWLMVSLLGWIVFTSAEPWSTLGEVYNLFIVYHVTVLALSSLERLTGLLHAWTAMILGIVALAMGGSYGFDPTGSQEFSDYYMKGRLALNTSIFANANALGHSVVPGLMMLYFVLLWRRLLFNLMIAVPLCAALAYCTYLTQSKGAFLAGAATITAGLCLGRSKAVQFWIVVLALTIGAAGLKTLPRMEDMQRAQTEEGIMGRLVAFNFGLKVIDTRLTGVGWLQWNREIEAYKFKINSHSSYVHIAGELGYPGLFLFCGLLYASMRTLIQARTTTDEEERVRRILFVLLFSYAASSWMIDWADRATFFMTIAAIGAFHRYLLNKADPTPQMSFYDPSVPRWKRYVPFLRPKPAAPLPPPPKPSARPAAAATEPPIWNRLGRLDYALMAAFTYATVVFWRYVMVNI